MFTIWSKFPICVFELLIISGLSFPFLCLQRREAWETRWQMPELWEEPRRRRVFFAMELQMPLSGVEEVFCSFLRGLNRASCTSGELQFRHLHKWQCWSAKVESSYVHNCANDSMWSERCLTWQSNHRSSTCFRAKGRPTMNIFTARYFIQNGVTYRQALSRAIEKERFSNLSIWQRQVLEEMNGCFFGKCNILYESFGLNFSIAFFHDWIVGELVVMLR